jgi:hypothetical protein
MGLKPPRRTSGEAPAAKAPDRSAAGTLSVDDLIAAKQLADSMGGLLAVHKALDTLEQLR